MDVKIPWKKMGLPVFIIFIYCAIAIFIQILMLFIFLIKVMCKKNESNIGNNGLIYLCFLIILMYSIITMNDMICIVSYALYKSVDQLEFFHTFIAIEWNVALILQYTFFLYRLYVISTTKYRQQNNFVYILVGILTIAEIGLRTSFYMLKWQMYIGLGILTIYDLIVSILILYIFYKLLHGILVNNDEVIIRGRLSTAMLDDNSFSSTMNAVRMSVGYSPTQMAKHTDQKKVIQIFSSILVLCGIIVFINLSLGIVATWRWYGFKNKSLFWMQALWVMDITAQIFNSLSVFLQFKATMGYYFKLCGCCHKCVRRQVVKSIYADSRFSVNLNVQRHN
eukprot:526537_1